MPEIVKRASSKSETEAKKLIKEEKRISRIYSIILRSVKKIGEIFNETELKNKTKKRLADAYLSSQSGLREIYEHSGNPSVRSIVNNALKEMDLVYKASLMSLDSLYGSNLDFDEKVLLYRQIAEDMQKEMDVIISTVRKNIKRIKGL